MLRQPWTFALLKPDAVANPIAIKWFLEGIFQRGLIITEGCRMQLPVELAERLYSEHKNAFYYGRLIRHVCSGPIVAAKLEYHGWLNEEDYNVQFEQDEAIKHWRDLLGPSKLFANMFKAECGEPDRIYLRNFRQLFAYSDTRNFGHGSDSLEVLQREFSIFKDFMRSVDDPITELFHLDRFILLDCRDTNENESDNEMQDIL